MPRKKRKHTQPTLDQLQPYDNLLKSLLEGYEQQLLPYFFAEAVYLETLDIETHRTTLRVDRVYKIRYKGKEHILHLEFETGADDDMDARLLDYHGYFHRKYKLPVISIIVYPFRTTMAQSPLREVGEDGEILIFHFHVFPLWKLRAEHYIQAHEILIYSLLPAMEGVNADLLNSAIDEMIEYYHGNEERLGQALKWMGIILQRADVMPLQDKRVIEERINMYDELVERDPKMKKMRAESEARGEVKGVAKGLRKAVLRAVKLRFPALIDQAQQKVVRMNITEELEVLLDEVLKASDEQTARLLFGLSAGQ